MGSKQNLRRHPVPYSVRQLLIVNSFPPSTATDFLQSVNPRVSADAEWSSECQGLGFYWPNTEGGNLADICNDHTNGSYEYVAISCLNFTDDGGIIVPPYCTTLGPDIDTCKGLGIKVFLSLFGSPQLTPETAPIVAAGICEAFLNDSSGPLGATVNGIDFHFRSEDGSNNGLDILAQALRDDCTPYLSGAPLCQIPDYYLDAAIRTGVFDYVWVQFFGDPSCEYSPANPFNLFASWFGWYSYIGEYNTTLFLGLTEDSAAEGFIPCDPELRVIVSLLEIFFPKFGGIMMLEGKFYCPLSSAKIRSYVNSDVLAYGRKSMNKFQAI
ncbi:acidic endochitinase-like [Coffea arabica]|uniref:Acidic endochitinase-like n=1 Tax=Coffea arabica TaxID=13443 RepID=A0A6P6SE44_COFAR|nr:acidic endochitinase-like [Coffea arabica]